MSCAAAGVAAQTIVAAASAARAAGERSGGIRASMSGEPESPTSRRRKSSSGPAHIATPPIRRSLQAVPHPPFVEETLMIASSARLRLAARSAVAAALFGGALASAAGAQVSNVLIQSQNAPRQTLSI